MGELGGEYDHSEVNVSQKMLLKVKKYCSGSLERVEVGSRQPVLRRLATMAVIDDDAAGILHNNQTFHAHSLSIHKYLPSLIMSFNWVY